MRFIGKGCACVGRCVSAVADVLPNCGYVYFDIIAINFIKTAGGWGTVIEYLD